MQTCFPKECPVSLASAIIGGKWKIPIIWVVRQVGTCRYSQLKRALPQITAKMLTQQLRELEEDGIIQRKVYPVVPPRVEYSLTNIGMQLIPVFAALNHWGEEYVKTHEQIAKV